MNLHFIEDFYNQYSISEGTQIVISLFIIFFVSFLLTRLTKKIKLPNVTAYIIAGVIIGPYVLNLIPKTTVITHMSFVTDIGLGFIAFATGRYFNLRMIKANGYKPAVIAVIQSLLTSVIVYVCLMPFKLSLPVNLVIASIAGTTSSASTLMTIRQYRCEGPFVDYTIELTALDNFLGIFSFSVCSGIALGIVSSQSGTAVNSFQTVWLPILVNLGMMVVGFLVGLFMAKVMITPTRSKDNRLILMTAAILVLVGLCGLVNVVGKNIPLTSLLSVMVMGATYLNLTNDEEIFKQVNDFSAPFILLFFVMSGMNFQLSYMATVGLAGITYFLVRSAAKYLTNYLGGKVTRTDEHVTRNIGLVMQPQAGISIGLAAISLSLFSNFDGDYGNQINAIIIFSGILYEIEGPALAGLALKLSGVLKDENRTKVEGMALKPMVVSTDSSLRDYVEIEKPTKEMIQRMNDLNVMKAKMDEKDRYVHTKEYTGEEYTGE